MKIRTGFVSNSSTTSFCIFGFTIDPMDAKFTATEETLRDWFAKLFPNKELEEDATFDSLREEFYEYVRWEHPPYSKSGDEYDDNIYVGRIMGSGDPMDTYEVLAKVRELYDIPESEKPHWIERAWRDG